MVPDTVKDSNHNSALALDSSGWLVVSQGADGTHFSRLEQQIASYRNGSHSTTEKEPLIHIVLCMSVAM